MKKATALGTGLKELLVQKQVPFLSDRTDGEIARLSKENRYMYAEISRLKEKISALEAQTVKAVEEMVTKSVQALKTENYIDAMGLLRAVLIFDSVNVNAMINLAVAYAALGFNDRARKTLLEVLANDPENETALRNINILDKEE